MRTGRGVGLSEQIFLDYLVIKKQLNMAASVPTS